MYQQRTRVVINVGNLLEVLGAGAAVYGVARLAGLGFALVLAGILAVAAAELIYDQHQWRVPLPHRPHPRVWTASRRQDFRSWRLRKRAAWNRRRARRRSRPDAWTGRVNL